MGTNCAIHWIEIYPVDSAIRRLNNRDLAEFVQQYRTKLTRGPWSWHASNICMDEMWKWGCLACTKKLPSVLLFFGLGAWNDYCHYFDCHEVHCKWCVTEAYGLFSFLPKLGWSDGGQQSTYGHSVTCVTCCCIFSYLECLQQLHGGCVFASVCKDCLGKSFLVSK